LNVKGEHLTTRERIRAGNLRNNATKNKPKS